MQPRIACIVVPDFPLAALYRTEPTLRDAPLVLTQGDDSGPRATIMAVSETAARLGVRAGLTVAQGTAISASLVFRTLPRQGVAQAALCEVAASCSPRVEDPSDGRGDGYGNGHGIAYLDARGAPFPSEYALGAALTARAARVGFDARIGVASTKTTARLAACQSAGVTVVPHGTERRFLAPLPIASLAPDPELLRTLTLWGITRIGELACLSPGAVGTRLGSSGTALVRRARGEDAAPLAPAPVRLAFEEEVELDYGIDTLEPLAFVLRGCLDRLAARLTLRSLTCGGLRISLGLTTHAREECTVPVAAPTIDVKVLLTLARIRLEAAPPGAPVEAIRVTAVPAHIRAGQLDLFRPAGPAPEHLATTLARLTAICGSGRVGAPVVIDTHRPEALALASFDPADSRRSASAPPSTISTATSSGRHLPRPCRPAHRSSCHLALRAIRPPRLIEVFDNRGRPDFVRGDGLGGRVVALAGPWRLAGEWWSPDRFHRDYYDMSLSDGGVYRVYYDVTTAHWFVEGEYD